MRGSETLLFDIDLPSLELPVQEGIPDAMDAQASRPVFTLAAIATKHHALATAGNALLVTFYGDEMLAVIARLGSGWDLV